MSGGSGGGAGGGPAQAVEVRRLAGVLRELRAETGLSLAALAAASPYSKSSWERYLNGKILPPRHAVEQLCKLAGTAPDRPLALWELAESAWRGRAGGVSSGGTPLAPEPVAEVVTEVVEGPPEVATRRRWLRSGGFLAGVFGGLAAVALGVLLVLWGLDGSGNGSSGAGPPARSAPGPACSGDTCTGKSAEATRCSTAARQPRTLAERRFGGGTVVKVRHSEICATVWARIDRGRTGDRLEITAPGISAQSTEVRDHFDEEASLSTPMAAAERADRRSVRVCLVRAGERSCFSL